MTKPGKIHDRLSQDLLINSVVSIAIVDDPFEKGAKLKVLRSIRDDVLAALYSRSQIDDAQYRAGRDAERLFEASYVGRISGIDPSRIMVDGGQFPEAITDKQIQANRELTRAKFKLGDEGYLLVRDILGDRMSISKAAEKRDCAGERGTRYTGQRFRECLETLAMLWHYAGTRRRT